MGCICTKQVVQKPASPGFGFSGMINGDSQAGTLGSSFKNQFELEKTNIVEECESYNSRDSRKLKKSNSKEKGSLSFRLSFSNRHVAAEQAAAGWPSWLSAVAGEAIQGWIPLKADSYEKLEKIGQGTYSSVFRARELETGKMFALKKVRFDNFQPESIRFMAREIMILRRLDHPNIMKLEGIITSRLSSSIYLVFEYMEHDLSGLISCPGIKFTDSQVKCYMKQLLLGLEHCHLHGVIHRDIKASNILVNNEGVLKLGDFGLANVLSSKSGQQLTSRVVTLWYRPPELLMGSTNYGVSVDLWSVGCAFAEILVRRPILKGRTEVEQLHKIFKLCGSPPEDYWKMSKIPHATMFKPQHSYESSLRERFRDVPACAVNLIENFLSIEPHKRGTASSALMSEYFRTPPYACAPSSLPKYPPNKEIDAKHREEARRKRSRVRLRETEAAKKATGARRTLEANNVKKLAPKEQVQDSTRHIRRNNGSDTKIKFSEATKEPLKLSVDATSGISEVTSISQGQSIFSGPIPVTGSSSFAWVKRRQDDALLKRSYSRSGSRSQVSAFDSSSIIFEDGAVGRDENGIPERRKVGSDFDSSELYYSQDLDMGPNVRERANETGDKDHNSNFGFSGPILSQSRNIEELLQRNEQHIRRAVRRTRLHREDDTIS